MAEDVRDEWDVKVNVLVGVGIEVVVGRDVMECVGDVEREEDVGDDVGVTTLSVPDIKDWTSDKPCPRGGLHCCRERNQKVLFSENLVN